MESKLTLFLWAVCETDEQHGWHLAADPSMACMGVLHLISGAICLPAVVCFLVGFPIALVRHANRCCLYNSHWLHERFLRWVEAEYLHRLSYTWRRSHFWLISSFHRRSVHHYAIWYSCMGVLMLLNTWLRDHPRFCADMWFLISWSLAVRQTIAPAFRHRTTNILAAFAYWVAAANGFFSLFRAHKMATPLATDVVFFLVMIWFNSAAGCIAITIVGTFCLTKVKWPVGIVSDFQMFSGSRAQDAASHHRHSASSGHANTVVHVAPANVLEDDALVDEPDDSSSDEERRDDWDALDAILGGGGEVAATPLMAKPSESRQASKLSGQSLRQRHSAPTDAVLFSPRRVFREPVDSVSHSKVSHR